MRELILLYWGCIFLMYLSQLYYPVGQLIRSNNRRSFIWRKADIFMVIVIVWMTCFSFLRTSYNDTHNYIYYWREAPTVSEFLHSGQLNSLTGNPLFLLWQSLSRELVDNYHVFFLLPSMLLCFATIKLFKQYSCNPVLSLLIFFSIGTYALYMAAVKQCFAMAFLLMALPYAINRKYIRFYIYILIAGLFHTHALIFAFLPLLLGKPWGKLTWCMLCVLSFILLTYNVTMEIFIELTQSMGLTFRHDEIFDGHQINILRIVVYWTPAILALVYRRRLFNNSTTAENLFVNMSIISAFILTLGVVQGANLYGRMAGYFEIATAIALPWMIQKIFTRQSAKLVAFMASFLYFGYFMYEFGVSKPFSTDYSAISLWQFIMELIH